MVDVVEQVDRHVQYSTVHTIRMQPTNIRTVIPPGGGGLQRRARTGQGGRGFWGGGGGGGVWGGGGGGGGECSLSSPTFHTRFVYHVCTGTEKHADTDTTADDNRRHGYTPCRVGKSAVGMGREDQ